MHALFYSKVRTFYLTRVAATIVFLSIVVDGWAQAPTWQLAQTLLQPTTGFSTVSSTVTDAVGNVYVAGYFNGTATWGTTTLTSAGGDDAFVAKWSPMTNGFVWAARAGGTFVDGAFAVAVAGSNVYIAGTMASATSSFGSITLANASAGVPDGFIAKLTDTGTSATFVWAQRAGGVDADEIRSMVVRGNDVYLAGDFYSSTIALGGTTLTNATVNTTTYTGDVFIAKILDAGPSGTFVWAQRGGGIGDDYPNSLAVNGSTIYVTGVFAGNAAPFGSTTLSSAGGSDAFVAALADASSSASFTWALPAGGTGRDQITSVGVDGSNVYIAGSYAGSAAAFGPFTLANTSTNGLSDAFVSKIIDSGPNGRFAWVQSVGGPSSEVITGLSVRNTAVYVVGGFTSPASTFGTTTLTNAGSNDVFLAKLLDAGPAALLLGQ